ncbi:MAG: hypothetical protein JRH01_13305 [Deltaproteobacteria bacterium]|nr:hypothetical protein [Deltaproteobacteria bacterium]MBW2393703.1 hypothetical protein [Deltaproteobacteria bacterium]
MSACRSLFQDDLRVTPRKLTWIWFAAIFLLVPWPWIGMGYSLVPALRYGMLASAGLAVAAAEGAQGPAPLIIGMFCFAFLLFTGLSWWIARMVGKLLGRAKPPIRIALTLLCVFVALLIALTTQPYRTPYGHAERGGLIEILS